MVLEVLTSVHGMGVAATNVEAERIMTTKADNEDVEKYILSG